MSSGPAPRRQARRNGVRPEGSGKSRRIIFLAALSMLVAPPAKADMPEGALGSRLRHFNAKRSGHSRGLRNYDLSGNPKLIIQGCPQLPRRPSRARPPYSLVCRRPAVGIPTVAFVRYEAGKSLRLILNIKVGAKGGGYYTVALIARRCIRTRSSGRPGAMKKGTHYVRINGKGPGG